MKKEVVRLRKETLIMLDKVFDSMYGDVPFPEVYRSTPLDRIILSLCIFYLNKVGESDH